MIKKLISFDGINWKDCGKFCNTKLWRDRIHQTTHIAEILNYDNISIMLK